MPSRELDDWEDIPAPQAAAPVPEMDDWHDVSLPRPHNTMLESGISGAADMLTFGHSDEIAAAGRAALAAPFAEEKFGNLYDQYLNEQRLHKQQAEEDNPKSYLAGQIGGGVAPALMGGPLALGPKVGASFGSNLLRAGGAGALMGAGQSNARPTDSMDKAEEFAGDALSGGLWNAGTYGVLSGAGAIARGVYNRVKPTSVGAVMLGMPKEAAEMYVKNPEAVNSAVSRPELTQKLMGSIDDLRDQVLSGSKGARDTLTAEGKTITGQQISDLAKKRIQTIVNRSEGVLDDEAGANVKWLQSVADQFSGTEEVAAKPFSTNRVKDLVQSLRNRVNYDMGSGKIVSVGEAVRGGMARDVDQVLKSTSPEYVKQMVGVAKDTDLLERTSNLAGSPQAMENLLGRIQRQRAFFPAQTVGELDTRMGTSYLNDLKLSAAKEALSKGAAGPGGSRMVNLYGSIGEDASKLTKIPFLKSIGAMVGATMDKYGPKIGKDILDTTARSRAVLQNSAAIQQLGKYGPILKAAASSGPSALVITNRHLMKDPEYRRALDRASGGEP
jgi:hypothetical protein